MEPFELQAVKDMQGALLKQEEALGRLGLSLVKVIAQLQMINFVAFVKGLGVGALITWLALKAF